MSQPQQITLRTPTPGTWWVADALTQPPDMHVAREATFTPIRNPNWRPIGHGSLLMHSCDPYPLNYLGAIPSGRNFVAGLPLYAYDNRHESYLFETDNRKVRFHILNGQYVDNFRNGPISLAPPAAGAGYGLVNIHEVEGQQFAYHLYLSGPWDIPINGMGHPQKTLRKLAGAYRGWRVWNRVDHELKAVVADYTWQPGWNETQYNPARDNKSGFFLLMDVNVVMSEVVRDTTGIQGIFHSGNLVLGSALAAGRMMRASKGVRAQKAKPEYIVMTGNLDLDADLLIVAEKYGMKPITLGDAMTLPKGIIPYEED
jgi:hypothetical protein